MTSRSYEAGLSLGSNLGDRLDALRRARSAVAALPGIAIVAASPVYETEPVGVRDEWRDLPYLNAVLALDCAMPPAALSAAIHAIETALGRVRTADRYAPRPIDIDILYLDALTLRTPELTVPHHAWTSRRFVVQPLADIRPELRLPGETRSCAEILSALPSEPKVVLFSRDWT